MKTAVMTDIRKVRIEEREKPVPKEGEVLVKVEYVGICGSDLHYYESGRIGNFIVEPPFVLGHEAGGTVVEVGSGVSHLKVGDRVALEPGKTCGHCEHCKEGEYNVSTLEGALVEPLSVGLHAAMQGGAHIGQTAVVTGAGCIGLVSLLALKAMGVSRVIVVDVIDKRLQKAKELGADYVINGKEQDTVAEIKRLTEGKGCDLSIETAGTQITASQLIQASKKGATIVFVGYSASGEMTLPIGMALDKELTFKTVFRYRNIYPMAIEAIAAGKIRIKDIVTDYFELDDIQHAMDACVENKAEIVKGVIRI